MALWLLAPAASAGGALDAHPDPLPEPDITARSTASTFDTRLSPRVPGALGMRSGALPYRVPDTRVSPGSAGSAAPLYGVLAARALLSAFHVEGALPGRATPWVDGDAEHMIAGFEFSF